MPSECDSLKAIAGVAAGGAARERQERMAAQLLRFGNAGGVEHGGHHVHVRDRRIHGFAARQPGAGHDQRHARGGLEQHVLQPQPVLAAHLTVIAGVDEERVVELPGLFQLIEDPAHVLVEFAHHAEVGGAGAPDAVLGNGRLHALEVREHLEHGVPFFQVAGGDAGKRHFGRRVDFLVLLLRHPLGVRAVHAAVGHPRLRRPSAPRMNSMTRLASSPSLSTPRSTKRPLTFSRSSPR